MNARFRVLIVFLCAGACFSVNAQEGGEGDQPISDWSHTYSLYDKGDQLFTVSPVGVLFPLAFTDSDGKALSDMPGNINLGGTGFLVYDYFLSKHFFVGGEISGMFASTRAKHYLFIIPLGFRVGAQVWLGKFEFPLSLMIGGASQQYQEQDMFDLFLKPSASAFFRFNSDWSFGINMGWWMVFEGALFGDAKYANDNEAHNSLGLFLELTLSARYHF